jgi:hypothetical protein
MAGLLNLNKAKVRALKLDALPNPNKKKESTVDIKEIKKEIKEDREKNQFDLVRDFYIKHSSKPTYAETARRFNIGVDSIAKIASEESWFEQRIVYWNQNSADQQQSIHSANESIFKSLSIVSQLAMKEHAQIMIDIEKAKKNGGKLDYKSYDPIYNIKDAMALVKLLNTNTSIMQDQLHQSEKTLEEMDDSELYSLLSEDEKYELDMFYNFDEAVDEKEKKLEGMNVF